MSVTDRPEESRFEATLDGQRVGFAAYTVEGGAITFTHTVVEPEFQGQGVATRLAATALASAQAHGLGVRPHCSYIAAYLRKHPEFAPLVTDEP
ncbi:MAG: GNAT family N-acetyltransferase [Actinomycetes bacterium]